MERRPISFQIKMLSNLFDRRLCSRHAGEKESLSGSGARIIWYLLRHSDEPVYQRDLERVFDVRRSTMTGILQGMEKQGLLLRQATEKDLRLKRLTLTPKAVALHEELREALQENERTMLDGLSQQEQDTLYALLERMKKNLL